MTAPDPDALDLIGQIVAQNTRDLAFTTDQIIASLERQVRDLATTLVEIDRALVGATVIDRVTEARLAAQQGRINAAYDILDRLQEQA